MPGGLSTVSKNVDAIMTSAFPAYNKQKKLFLYACNVYKKILNGYSQVA